MDAFKESEKLLKIRAVIYVSHESQKGIVIGKGGAALKKASSCPFFVFKTAGLCMWGVSPPLRSVVRGIW